ncbi:MAG: hypothetical protein O3A63_00035 [Proteobacteria bacterium]|nr:hypothetical protein [Pseudomonadota bacterium]
MSLAETLLRLGCSFVAWLVLYTHCLWLPLFLWQSGLLRQPC